MVLRLSCIQAGSVKASYITVCKVVRPLVCRRQGNVQAALRLCRRPLLRPVAASVEMDVPEVKDENIIPGMTTLLDSLKWNSDGLVAVIVQVGYGLYHCFQRLHCLRSLFQFPVRFI